MSTTVLSKTSPISYAIRHFSATVRCALNEVDLIAALEKTEEEVRPSDVEHRLHDLLAGYASAIEASPKATDETWMTGALYGISANAPGYMTACEIFKLVVTEYRLAVLRSMLLCK